MAAQRNKLAYVTGSSRGIGKALAKALIDAGYRVIGLSRTNDWTAENYQFVSLDLSNLSAVKKFKFEDTDSDVLLVNNAGTLGEIGPIGEISDQAIEKTMIVNTLSPQILMNRFIDYYQGGSARYHILNISSGAGKRPITSWASYCASKAAIDLFSQTCAEEWNWMERDNWFIHSCAPGVVDTEMQSEIRSSSEEDFKDVDRFKVLKETGELSEPENVAGKLMQLIKAPENYSNVIVSVRDF